MSYWAIKVEAWPVSTGNGQAVDQAAAGPRERKFVVRAQEFDEAVKLAEAIRDGVLSHDRIWKAPIRSVDYVGETRP